MGDCEGWSAQWASVGARQRAADVSETKKSKILWSVEQAEQGWEWEAGEETAV